MMRAITFNCTSNHTVVSGLISSKNKLKARLRAAGEADVSDDERLPEAPLVDIGFGSPTGPEWADFFPEASGASGSGTHSLVLAGVAPFCYLLPKGERHIYQFIYVV